MLLFLLILTFKNVTIMFKTISNDDEKLWSINRNKSLFKLALYSDHPYRIFIIGGSGTGKTNMLLNLIKDQRPDIGKSCLIVKDSLEPKHQLLINGREKVRIKRLKKSVAIHWLCTNNSWCLWKFRKL